MSERNHKYSGSTTDKPLECTSSVNILFIFEMFFMENRKMQFVIYIIGRNANPLSMRTKKAIAKLYKKDKLKV